MNKSIYLLLIASIFGSCVPYNAIKQIEFTESGYNSEMIFNAEKDNISFDDVDIKITPLSANSLDSIFYKESYLNGKLNYSYYESSRKTQLLTKPSISSKNKTVSDFDILITAISTLQRNGKISKNEAERLTQEILEKIKDIDEVSNKSKDLSYYNPYHIGGKYYNVFQVELFNNSNEYKSFSKQFLFENGSRLNIPLSTNEIIEELEITNNESTPKSLSR
jgi:hypothetical protein